MSVCTRSHGYTENYRVKTRRGKSKGPVLFRIAFYGFFNGVILNIYSLCISTTIFIARGQTANWNFPRGKKCKLRFIKIAFPFLGPTVKHSQLLNFFLFKYFYNCSCKAKLSNSGPRAKYGPCCNYIWPAISWPTIIYLLYTGRV